MRKKVYQKITQDSSKIGVGNEKYNSAYMCNMGGGLH